MIKIYNQLRRDERRKFKNGILELRKNIIRQNELLEKLFLKHNQDFIKSCDDVLKNKISIEEFKINSQNRNKRQQEILEFIELKGGCKNVKSKS